MSELGGIERALHEIAQNLRDPWEGSDRRSLIRTQEEMVKLQKELVESQKNMKNNC